LTGRMQRSSYSNVGIKQGQRKKSILDAIRNFYRDMKETEAEELKGPEGILLAAASRIKSMGLTDESISRAFGIPVTTLRRKAEEYGLSWAVDKSEKNIDRYKRVKTVE